MIRIVTQKKNKISKKPKTEEKWKEQGNETRVKYSGILREFGDKIENFGNL